MASEEIENLGLPIKKKRSKVSEDLKARIEETENLKVVGIKAEARDFHILKNQILIMKALDELLLRTGKAER